MVHRIVVGAIALMPVTLAAQGIRDAVNSITPEDVRHRIGILAHDSMRGRDTPSPEIEETANYIAGQFRSFGLSPLGDEGSYLQRYPLLQESRDLESTRIWIGDTELIPGEDFGFMFGAPRGQVGGDAVFVSGTVTDLSQIAALDLGGKAVIVLAQTEAGNFTPGFRPVLNGLFRRPRPSMVIVVSDRPEENFAGTGGDRLRTTKAWDPSGQGGFAYFEVRVESVANVLRQAGIDLARAMSRTGEGITATPIPGLAVRGEFGWRVVNRTSAPNVVGLLEGSDPDLRDEYVVFSAHMDHIGVGTPDANGDSIYNGADDDASGTVGVIELAEAFAMMNPRPRRSIIFLTVSAEEKGLWGSEFFAANMPVPAEQIVADLNIDMIGRNWTDTIVAIGKEHSDLGATLDGVNGQHPELNMTAIDDIWPDERFYFRSDHFNFARNGIPILFFFNGTHEDYHGRDDEVDRIDAEKHARITRLNFYLGLEIANRDERPAWNPESYEEIVGSSR